jgi:hypothetical protein
MRFSRWENLHFNALFTCHISHQIFSHTLRLHFFTNFHLNTLIINQPFRLAYQPPSSSTFLSEQTSHQQPASSTFLSEQISTSHQPPTKRTDCATSQTNGLCSRFTVHSWHHRSNGVGSHFAPLFRDRPKRDGSDS